MSKMFVHYSGTVASFKEAKKDGKSFEEFYSNHIVFIKGGESGTGAAVYTHGEYFGDLAELQAKVNGLKYFSKISDGNTIAEVASASGTITIQGEDPAVTTKIDPTGIKIGLSDEFKTAVNTTLPGAISGVDAKLGAKDAVAASGSDATAFGRIKNLETIVAGLTGEEGGEVESVDAKITNAIDKLDVDAKAGDYVASISQADGLIVPVMGTFNFDEAGAADAAKSAVIGASSDASSADTIYGAKKYAEEKANDAKSGAEATASADATAKANKALEDAKAYADGLIAADSDFEKRVAANEAAIGVLNGEGEGSVKKSVADAIAGVVANAPEDFDTLKEVADWIGSDTTGAAQMQADIATLKGADTVEGSVAKTVKDAVAAEAIIARAAEKENADAIKNITDNYVSNDTFGEFSTLVREELSNVERVAAEAYTDLDKRVVVLENKESIIDSALQESDITTGSANGTISVKGSDISVAGLKSAAYTESSAYATAAQGALAEAAAPANTVYTKTEVDNFWSWEEL